jgi:shikimate kinase
MNATPQLLASALQGLGKSLVIVGMPGSGKSSVGRRLARDIGLPFIDSDTEIERNAGMKIVDIFTQHGEPEFRRQEQATIARLLEGNPIVLATGGGAFMNVQTRQLIKQRAVSIWLNTPLDVLTLRTATDRKRPLLQQDSDKQTALRKLLAQREAIYATADFTVISDRRPVKDTVARLLSAVTARHQLAEI